MIFSPIYLIRLIVNDHYADTGVREMKRDDAIDILKNHFEEFGFQNVIFDFLEKSLPLILYPRPIEVLF